MKRRAEIIFQRRPFCVCSEAPAEERRRIPESLHSAGEKRPMTSEEMERAIDFLLKSQATLEARIEQVNKNLQRANRE